MTTTSTNGGPRIGFYICHCGTNIGGVVNCQAVAGLQDYFCGGPAPVTAEGKTKTEKGRRLFGARTVTIPNSNRTLEESTNAVRIIFPI